ncbi:polysaccharide deacetylase family protein, partial [Enterobacter kobei]|nr:polysaccharide deacetylase family protein [Enterobacter kobei]
MLNRLFFCLLLLATGVAQASLLGSEQPREQYMQITEDAAIWAKVGDNVQTVGIIREGQLLAVVPIAADYYEFRFGFGTGFIDKAHLT